jgi:SAM-dependent methyltransferase
LDLGCGAGAYLKLVLDTGPARRVTGVDLCPEMIKAARETAPTGTFYCQDLRTFNYSENAYDAVILASVINHLKDDELQELAAKMAYTIKPDGLIFVNFWSGEYSGFKLLEFADKPMLINYYDDLYISSLMRRHHFANLKVQRAHCQLGTSIGPEVVQDCYYFGHLLKDVDMSLRLKSVVTEPMIFCAGGQRKAARYAETAAGKEAAADLDAEADTDAELELELELD